MAEEINRKTKKLFKRLVIANKTLSERDEVKEEYDGSLAKLKGMISKDKNDPDLVKEIDILEKQIVEMLSKEKKVIEHVYDEQSYSNRLVKSIDKLEKKLDRYMKFKEQRQKRIIELEEKISDKLDKKKTVKKKKSKKSVKKKTVKKKTEK